MPRTVRLERPESARTRAVLIESQRLFVPYLVRTIGDTGADVVFTARRPHVRRLRAARPDVVVIDASNLCMAPLAAIRAVRAAAPEARIVVYAAADTAWSAVARAVGATVVLGGEAGGSALRSAVSAT